MSNKETGFIKILFLILVIGVSNSFLGCAPNKSQLYSDGSDTTAQQDILNGFEVTNQNPISKKVLFLATGAKLLKTPSGGFTASLTGQCTASAISPKIILTAAHCLKSINPKDDQTPDSVFIILGTKPWKSKFDSKLWFAADQIIVHENYKKTTGGGSPHDLALIRLKSPLPDDYVTELAQAKDLQSSMALVMAGFGLRTNANGISISDSKKNLGELFQISKMISNFDVNNLTIDIDQHDQKGICSGDSGGPGLIFNPETKKYTTIGVASGNRWIDSDKLNLDPLNQQDCFGFAVYTNVMNPIYSDWIQKMLLILKSAGT